MYVYKVEMYDNKHNLPTIIHVVGKNADDALEKAQAYNEECLGLNYWKVSVDPSPKMWVLA